MDRPRLLLIPEFTELEWEVIRPRLEEWAEVASFDPPGVGDEPPLEKLDRQLVADRGLEELDRLGWNECFLATDSWAIPSAVRVAIARPQTVIGMALGHAKLSYRREGERAPVNGPVYDAMLELIRTDHEAFIRHGIAQSTRGSISEDLAQRMIARVSRDLLVRRWEAVTGEDEDIGALLAQVDCPLLFANTSAVSEAPRRDLTMRQRPFPTRGPRGRAGANEQREVCRRTPRVLRGRASRKDARTWPSCGALGVVPKRLRR